MRVNNGENWSAETYRAAEGAIGYQFRDKELLIMCFTHSTYANNCGGKSNERLEWLGDAVLGLVVSDMLYRDAVGETEGTLTNRRKQYVCMEALTPIAEKLNLMRYLRHSGGKDNLNGKTMSNLFEAVVGGIYLDGGFEAAKHFLEGNLAIAEIIDYKTMLQEYVQAKIQAIPEYRTWEEDGVHVSVVSALGKQERGTGSNDKAAEVAAARALYNALTETK